MKSIENAKKKAERRYGKALWGHPNSSFAKREYAPGQHGQRRKKQTDYGEQLYAKQSLKSSYGNRIIATEWDTHKKLSFLVYIYIKGIDNVGLLNEITQVISRQLNVNIRKLDMETDDGIFEGKVQLYVHDVEDVKAICNNLRKIPNIKSVTRVEN